MQWLPEYGGHLLLKEEDVTSILPKFNRGVIFESSIYHMGLEPSKHCPDIRESIACKFEVILD
jgi:Rps23 Pro-64 3,4-dihydroxylase Tpa1-like proline 4-hydroxylase